MIAGCFVTLFLVMLVHLVLDKNFYKEFKESFKLPKDDKPMGEVLLDEMIKENKHDHL